MHHAGGNEARNLLKQIKQAYDLCGHAKFGRLANNPYQGQAAKPWETTPDPAGQLSFAVLKQIQPLLPDIINQAKITTPSSSDRIQMSNPDIIGMLQRMKGDIVKLPASEREQITGMAEAIDAEIAKIPVPRIDASSATSAGELAGQVSGARTC